MVAVHREAIVGARLGTVLERVPSQIVAFSDLAVGPPDARVLSRDTGHSRPYVDNPYVGYDSAGSPFLFEGDTGGPLPQMARVVTAGGAADPVAFPWEVLQRNEVTTTKVDGNPVVALWAPGTASALDAPTIAEGDDIGAVGVFRPVLEGRPVTLKPAGDGRFTDRRTGSTWSVVGEAVDGTLKGAVLEAVAHDDTFWFVQYAFRPDTRVVAAG